ncbi:MAG: multiheme c-type cytochrome [Terriglobales bacterium]
MGKIANSAWHAVVCLTLGLSSFAQNAPSGKYDGPGGCASSSCHGSIQPKQVTRVAQNEYSIWAGQDKHARAYQVLSNPVSLRIGKILNIGRPDQAQKCLACHALSVPSEQRAESFELADGVSCESCHGPASGWLGPHTTRDWPHEKSLQLGMYDTRDLIRRSERCLSCHLGTSEKWVDHEMIAAGHPDLTFELNLFSAVMPRHWKEPADSGWRGVQVWGVGEAVQLQKGLERLARRASSNSWPEYAESDCFACHHSLTKPEDSWRQEMGYAGRQPGVPAWNQSRYVVFRHIARKINSDAAAQLDADVKKLATLLGQRNENPQEIVTAASRAASVAGQFAQQLNSKTYDQAFTVAVMRSIAQDGDSISAQGQRAAEQAAMSLDSLFVAYKQNAKSADESDIRESINGLFQQVDNPSAYNAPRFAAQMQKVSSILARTGRDGKASQ